MKVNKKIIGGGLTLALACCLGVGATLAYLNHVTDEKTNTFTSSRDIDTTITETGFNQDTANNYYPGQAIAKNPQMKNDSQTESIWVAVKLDYLGNDGEKLSEEKFKEYAEIVHGTEGNYTSGVNAGWVKLASNGKSDVYMFNTKVAPGTSTDPAVFDAVQVNAGIKEVVKNEYKDTTVYDKDKNVISKASELINSSVDYYDADGKKIDVFTLPKFEVVVKGFAVQEAGVDEATAKTELINLVNANLADGEDAFTQA